MSVNQIMFILFASIIVIFSILTVSSKRILRSALYLLFVLVSTAGLYFMMNYNFLAAVQITLYAGGIVVLIIFSVLLTSRINDRFASVKPAKAISTVIVTAIGAFVSISSILQHNFVPAAGVEPISTDVKMVGMQLLGYGTNGYALPFEVISVLLLASMIGAIIIAKKKLD